MAALATWCSCMSLRSATLTASGTWRCPTGVSFVWVNRVGGGGGGGYQGGFLSSQDGGGAGEFSLGEQLPVTPNTIYSITVGGGGTHGIALSATGATDGAATTFAGFSSLGGRAGTQAGGTPSGFGGGPNGGGNPVRTTGGAGTAESPVSFGGASGGANGGSVGQSGGQQIGEYPGSPGFQGSSAGDGCGGASSIWAAGGLGGLAYNGVGDGSGTPAPAGTLGSGGGGAPADAGGAPNKTDGSDGGTGLISIFYIAP